MSKDLSQLGLIVGTTAALNLVHGSTKGKDLTTIGVASAVAYVALATVGGITGRWELPIAAAWVFLIAALVFRGLPLIQVQTELAKSGGGKALPNTVTNKTTTGSDGSRSSSGSF